MASSSSSSSAFSIPPPSLNCLKFDLDSPYHSSAAPIPSSSSSSSLAIASSSASQSSSSSAPPSSSAMDKLKESFTKTSHIRDITIPFGAPLAIAWSSDGKKIAYSTAPEGASASFSLKFATLEGSQFMRDTELKGHSKRITCITWDPNMPDRLYSGSEDRSVRIWDTKTPAQSRVTIAIPGEASRIAISGDGTRLTCLSKELGRSYITVWDMTKSTKICSLKVPPEVSSIALNNDGSLAYFVYGRNLEVARVSPELPRFFLHAAHTDLIKDLQIDQKGKYIAMGSADGLASVWSTEDFICRHAYSRAGLEVRSVAISHDSQFLSTVSEDGYLDTYHLETATPLHRVKIGALGFMCSWNPTSNILAYAYDDRTAVPPVDDYYRPPPPCLRFLQLKQ